MAHSVTVDTKIRTEREMLFPAITVCNVNPIKKSALFQRREMFPDLANLLLEEKIVDPDTEEDPDLGDNIGPQVQHRRKRTVSIGRETGCVKPQN